jgi:hypothetical protein
VVGRRLPVVHQHVDGWWLWSGVAGAQIIAGVSTSSSPSGGMIELLVPADTAVAALGIDGEPVGWQRPRGRTVQLGAPSVERFTVTAYDAAGSVIGDHRGDP